MSASDDPAPAIELAFLKRLLADRNRGEERSLVDYQALFPGYEDLVEAAYSRALSEPAGAEERTFADGIDVGSSDLAASELLGDSGTVGHYQVVSELGRGGQGVVYLAEDTRLGRRVALKVLTKVGLMSEQMVRRFRREAEVASRIAHPGICTVYDAGTAHGVPFIAMQYVEGETLAHRMREVRTGPSFVSLGGEPPSEESSTPEAEPASTTGPQTQAELNLVLELIEKTARALHAAHATGVIHRDIKPGNIMVTPDGEPVLLDFGLARELEASQASLTATGDLFGTLAYMSPEQLAAKRVSLDARTDVYSLGVSLYECVAGMRPFDAPTRQGLIQAILTTEPLNIRRLNKAVSRDLRVVVETAVEKERDRRYSTALDLAEDLKAVREGRPIAAKGIGTVGRIVRWSKREPAKASLLVVMLLTLPTIAVLVTQFLGDREKVLAQELAELRDRVDERLSAGYYEVGEGDKELAIKQFEAALALDSKSEEAALGIALAHLDRGSPSDALKTLERFQVLLRGRVASAMLRVDVLRTLNPETELSPLLESPTDALGFYLMGQIHMSRGHGARRDSEAAFRDAYHAFTSAVLLSDRPRPLFYEERLHAAGHLGDEKAVRATATAVEKHWPMSAAAAFHKGRALAMCGLFEEGCESLRRSDRLRPKVHTTLSLLGFCLWKVGELEEARDAYRQSIALNPFNAESHQGLGDVLVALGDVNEGVASLNEAIRRNPDLGEAHCSLGTVQMKRGELESAAKSLRRAIQCDPTLVMAYNNLGNTLDAMGETGRAMECYRTAISVDPKRSEPHSNLGFMLLKSGRFEEAAASCRTAIELNPKDPGAHMTLGAALVSKGDKDEGVKMCRKAVKLAPQSKEVRTNLGRALEMAGQPEEAIKSFQEVFRIDPAWRSAHQQLLRVLKAQQDHAGVRDELQRWAELHPNDARAWHDLAQHLVRIGRSPDLRDSDAAVSAATRAVELSGESSAATYTTLAHALYQAEEFERALTAGEKALSILRASETEGAPSAVEDTERFLRRIKRALDRQ